MTARDRLVLSGIVVLGLLAGLWLLVIAPEREKAATLGAQVSTAAGTLQAAEGTLASARRAQAQYPAAYASVVSLGKAVPASEEVPSLLYQLAHVADAKHVTFATITNGGAGSPTAPAAAAPTAFAQMPFNLTFEGTYSDLYALFRALDESAVRSNSGGLQISGRLLTVQSVKLAPASSGGPAGPSGSSEQVSGTVGVTAYVLPAGQQLTAGGTAGAPASATTSTPASAATTPAVVTP